MKILGSAAACILAVLAIAASWLMVYSYRLLTEEDLTFPDEAAAVQALAAAVSLLATVLLVGITTWYAWISRRLLQQSRPVVSVELSVGWMPQTLGHGVLLGPFSSLISGPPDERYPMPYLAVQIRNAGNLAASISRVSIESNAGFSFAHTMAPVGPSCPFELEAHSSQTAFVRVDDMIASIKAWHKAMGKSSSRVRAMVELGSGIAERSKWEQLPSI